MTRRTKWIGITLVILLIISVNIYYDKITIIKWYAFENREGTFSISILPAKGKDEDWMHQSYEDWRIQEGIAQGTDTVLYRTFKKDYFKFWQWSEYMTNDLYDYPFKKPKINE